MEGQNDFKTVRFNLIIKKFEHQFAVYFIFVLMPPLHW